MARRYEKSALSPLHKVLVRVKPSKTPVWFPRLPGSSSDGPFSTVDCDQVYPNVYIGDENSAKNKLYLRTEGITHVLNTAEGDEMGQVNTGSDYYRDVNVSYLGLNLLDLPGENAWQFFGPGASFIEKALAEGGKVLVHCSMGMSRSATIVCAYLMTRRGMSAEEALTTLRAARAVRPNDGFLRQLLELERSTETA